MANSNPNVEGSHPSETGPTTVPTTSSPTTATSVAQPSPGPSDAPPTPTPSPEIPRTETVLMPSIIPAPGDEPLRLGKFDGDCAGAHHSNTKDNHGEAVEILREQAGGAEIVDIPKGEFMFLFSSGIGRTLPVNFFYDSGCSAVVFKECVPGDELPWC